MNISSGDFAMPQRQKLHTGENDWKVYKRRIKSKIYFESTDVMSALTLKCP